MKKSLLILSLMVLIHLYAISSHAKNIGIAWMGHSGMSENVASGFNEKIHELAPTIEIEYRKAVESLEDFGRLVKQWEKEKDGMVLLRSSAVKWLSKNPISIPTFIGGCNHPTALGLKNRNNITGVTYHLSKASQFGVFKAIIPDFNSFVLLLEKGHPGSVVDQQATQKAIKGRNIKYIEALHSTKEELIDTVKTYKGKVSAFIIGSQALVMDNAESIVTTAENTPVLSYSKTPIKKGALAGFAADDVKLGKILAESLVDVLVNGQDINQILIKSDPSPVFFINKKTLEKFGYTLPTGIKRRAAYL